MTETQNPKKYDLEERTFEFAKRVRAFVKNLSKTVGNIEDGKQVVRSSGSQAANYIETKESELWLKLCEINDTMENERQQLLQEALELRKIFGSIIEKSK